MMSFEMKYAPHIDLSDFTYQDLENLEEEIIKRKEEYERTQYKTLINGVLNAINAIIEAGYGHVIACYDDEAVSYNWTNLSYEIAHEYKRREEDY